MNHCIKPLILLLPMFGLLVMPGCGNSAGSGRYEASGNVTWRGKPVEAGMIIFEPDTKRGNSGPAGMADIHDGKYRTKSGKGIAGGPLVARLQGGDGKDPGPFRRFGTPYTPKEVRRAIDLPRENATHDFEMAD